MTVLTEKNKPNSGPGYITAPNYDILISKTLERRLAVLNGEFIADSRKALVLKETGYGLIYYFPRSQVRLDLAVRSEHRTFCPYKGTASYWSFGDCVNIAWSYEAPYDEVVSIKEYIAFYQHRLDRFNRPSSAAGGLTFV